jgi:beta-galactosidase
VAELRGAILADAGRGSASRGGLPRRPQALHVGTPVLGAHRAQAVLAAGLLGEVDDRRLVRFDAVVALLVSRRAALFAFASDRQMDIYRDAVLGAYRLLTDLDLPVMVLHEDFVERDGVPAHVDRIYWPMPTIATEPLASAISSFVEGGGRLVSEALPGEYGPDGRRQVVAPGFGLDHLLGVREIEPDSDIYDIEVDGDTLQGAWQRALVEVRSADVIGSFQDGAPAVTTRLLGDGIAIHIGTYPSVAYCRDRGRQSRVVVGRFLDEEAVPRPVRWLSPMAGLVGRGATTKDGRRLRFALNWTDADTEGAVDFEARVIRAAAPEGEVIAGGATVQVPARSGVLFVETCRLGENADAEVEAIVHTPGGRLTRPDEADN